MAIKSAERKATTVLLHEETGRRRSCAECGESIPLHTEFTRQDGLDLHLFCAADAGFIAATCTRCFLLDCEC